MEIQDSFLYTFLPSELIQWPVTVANITERTLGSQAWPCHVNADAAPAHKTLHCYPYHQNHTRKTTWCQSAPFGTRLRFGRGWGVIVGRQCNIATLMDWRWVGRIPITTTNALRRIWTQEPVAALRFKQFSPLRSLACYHVLKNLIPCDCLRYEIWPST